MPSQKLLDAMDLAGRAASAKPPKVSEWMEFMQKYGGGAGARSKKVTSGSKATKKQIPLAKSKMPPVGMSNKTPMKVTAEQVNQVLSRPLPGRYVEPGRRTGRGRGKKH